MLYLTLLVGEDSCPESILVFGSLCLCVISCLFRSVLKVLMRALGASLEICWLCLTRPYGQPYIALYTVFCLTRLYVILAYSFLARLAGGL